MKRKTNKTKEEAWSQTAHAPDGEQPGPEASDTSGQSVPKSKFRKKSQQEQAAAAKLRMESQGEKLEQAREKLAKQKPPKKPGPVKRIGRVASDSVHSFVHGKIFEVEQENVGTEGAHRSELVGETALRHGSRFVRRKVREHPAKVVRNYDRDCGCLPLDCECYMFGKCWTGAYCRYFREAVLPLDPALEAALLTEGPRPDFKACPVCGRAVAPDGRQTYCSAACAKAAHRRQQREYMRKKRG